MSNAWPLMTAALVMGAGGSLHCMAMCAGLQRMTLRGIPVVTVPASAADSPPPTDAAAAAAARQPAHSHANRPDLSPVSAATPGNTPSAGTPSGRSKPTAATGNGPLFRMPDGRWWRFQAGRVLGYSLLGAATGFFGQQLLAAAAWQPVFESVWAGLNAVLLLLGLSLLVLGREPVWLAAAGYRIAGRIGPSRWRHTEWLRGMLWAFLPCGLLYTALATAILAATPLAAAFVMAAFALGTTLGLMLVESGLRSLLAGKRPELAYRLNGLFLSLLAGAALAAALTGMEHPFC